MIVCHLRGCDRARVEFTLTTFFEQLISLVGLFSKAHNHSPLTIYLLQFNSLCPTATTAAIRLIGQIEIA